jgi:hypothetical protein
MGLFWSIVAVAFQNVFCLEMHEDKIFLKKILI